ncbi:oxygenase MpaB family protein [Paractinoplanes rishiriensis]|uniref:Peptidase n=1 Tax=Paractinoplanes rishiriensis TaxID=1050105 RepID=A0A919JTY5_9ACTN|nr:oxygenase MpaB family protein [Actinoplanes rishiriensis]GIE93347.1 peptidase [Actinoplanes rishiriensis]
MRDRYATLRRIQALDPARDYLAIYQTMLRFEFPWDLRFGINLAFNRSFAMPPVAALLVGTGELTERTRKRIDDTGILMYEIVLNGFDHPRGRAALRRVNQIHRPYRDVPGDEYLYVLACAVVIPLRWLDRYGWRQPCCHEREATYRFFRELGRRMHITGIPESADDLHSWFEAYDRRLVPDDNAAAIERATRMHLRKRLPLLTDALIGAVYDDRFRAAAKVARPPWRVRAGLHAALRARARWLRHLGRPRRTGLFEGGVITTATYPDGYEIAELGPASALPDRPDDDGGEDAGDGQRQQQTEGQVQRLDRSHGGIP